VTFFANIYDPTESLTSVTLILDDERIPMFIDIGTPFNGTYSVNRAVSTNCRHYKIEVAYTDAPPVFYPESGTIPTTGEGSCEDIETGKQQIAITDSRPRSFSAITVAATTGQIRFSTRLRSLNPITTDIFTPQGVRILNATWRTQSPGFLSTQFPRTVLIVRHRGADGTRHVQRLLFPTDE
jgi:hypothetical protein